MIYKHCSDPFHVLHKRREEKKHMKVLFAGVFIAIILGSTAVAQKASSIEGVWRLDDITADGKTQKISQPSMYFFTKKNYSIIYVSSDAPRPILADLKTA